MKETNFEEEQAVPVATGWSTAVRYLAGDRCFHFAIAFIPAVMCAQPPVRSVPGNWRPERDTNNSLDQAPSYRMHEDLPLSQAFSDLVLHSHICAHVSIRGLQVFNSV